MLQTIEYSPVGDPKKRMRGVNKKAGFGDKSNKGLRHFSMKVCQKVEEKGTTTYNEVSCSRNVKVVSHRLQLTEIVT
jgi:hypothetical protein